MKMTKTVLLATGAAAAVAATGFATSANAICNGDPDNANCPPANVVHARGTVNVTPPATLGVRTVPKYNARQFRQLPNGATVLITCQTIGDKKVSGPYGRSAIYDHLKKGGFVPDVYVYTGSDGMVAPQCGS